MATIASWLVTLFVLFIYPSIDDSTLRKKQLGERAIHPAAEKKLTREPNCPPTQISAGSIGKDNTGQTTADYLQQIN